LYDTSDYHPFDRYDHYRTGARVELAPVEVHGDRPGSLLAKMSATEVGEFVIETITWSADREVVAKRTDRLIRACYPDCYRLYLNISSNARMEQAGNQLRFRDRDVALFDLSRPWQAVHPTGSQAMRVVMLTFPKTLLPIDHATLRPLLGTAMPRALPDRSLIAQWLIELIDELTTKPDSLQEGPSQSHPESLAEGFPKTADVLRESVLGLIRQRLGQPDGITAATRRPLHLTRVHGFMLRNLSDAALTPDRIAKAVNISQRSLHQLFDDTGLTLMQRLKRMRLQACHRALRDPARSTTPIGKLAAECGYTRQDQFARDFKQLFKISARQVRQSCSLPQQETADGRVGGRRAPVVPARCGSIVCG
jgi:AraC-like DNA-binding protein